MVITRLAMCGLLATALAGLCGFEATAPEQLPIAALPPMQDADAEKKSDVEGEKKEEEITLERFFPEKSFFGPRARSTEFSFDGRYGAWLYRPYKERRHGNDLWILDTQSGEVKRLTNVVVMSEFQEDTRKVKEDRIAKAKKAGVIKGKEAEQTEGEVGDAEQEAVRADDVVSGTWEGRVTGGAEMGIPPEGVPFTLNLQLHADDTVTGTMTVMGMTVNLTDGRWEASDSRLTARLVDNESGQAASLEVKLSNGSMSGGLTVENIGATLSIEGRKSDRPGASTTDLPHLQDGDADAQDEGKDQDEQKDEKSEKEQIDEEDAGNWVSDKDADDEKSPRYDGVQSFEWSPITSELIIISQGDLYRLNIEDGDLLRLTKTRDFERGVQYLPDGSGYTYMDGDAVMKVNFGSHLREQLNPSLPGGESMMGYELSPDGTRMVFLSQKVLQSQASRTVNIISYRDRFAQVRQVPRHVSDDKLQRAETSVWLYEMRDPMREEYSLKKVYTHTYTGPRDILQVPEWAPNSSKVGFAVHTQATGTVDVYQASFPEKEESSDDETSASTDGKDSKADDKKEPEIEPASLVYKFFHNGGPTTPSMIHPYFLPDSRHMAFLTEQSGFRHVHILDPLYETLEQITSGKYEVYPFDISEDHRFLFCTSTRESSTRDEIYTIDLVERSMKRISQLDGDYGTVAISNDGTKALANYVTYGKLNELNFIDATKPEQRELTDSHPEEAHELTNATPEFFTYENRHGQTIHGKMFKPDDWNAEDQRPLLIYVYGGPLGTRKQVTDGSYGSADYFFPYYMAKKHGWMTCVIDPRGNSGYGGLFEKSNYEQVGKPQTEDLVDGAKWFIANQGVDAKKVTMHGWSFGGFQTQMCLYTEPDVFAAGIAGAGPTEWENYNSWYSQGTIGQTGEGTADLKKYSLLPLAKNLKARLLLVHGVEDSNVLYQDTVRVYRELLKAGKEDLVDLFLDPTGGHGLGGDVKTLGRYRKYEAWLLDVIGSVHSELDENDADEDEKHEENAAEAEGDGDE